jgi:hypothetical protein
MAWVGDVLGNHRLAETLRGDEDDVAGGLDEIEVEGGLDGGAVEALGPGPVEIGHGLEAADAAVSQAALKAFAGTVLGLRLDDTLEELGVAPAVLGGERDEIVDGGTDVVQADALELVSEGIHRSFSWSSCERAS